MKIKVIGKQHMEGTSKKTGQPYNFNTIYFNAPAYKVEGLASKSINLDPSQYPFSDVIVGGEYNLEFDERGYCVSFLPVTKS